jgi:hypothetical protein
MASHTDKDFYSNASIPKADWERIFGEFKPSDEPEQLKKQRPKKKSGRDDFTNRHLRWV